MKKFIFASGLMTVVAFGAHAQNTNLAFAPGELAVLRAGDGVTDLGGKQSPMFVDEFDPNNLNNTNLFGPQLSVVIPTTGDYSTPAKSPLFINGQAATEGAMTRSADRTILTWAGYAAPLNNFGGTPSGLGINRGFCTIDAFTNYNLIYFGQDWYGGAVLKTNPRGIASDGTNFWGSGGTDGNEFYAPGIDPFQFQSIANSTRSVKIINNILYTSINAGDAIPSYPAGIYDFIDDSQNLFPLPNATAGLNLVIPATAPYTAINGFDINPQGTIAYVADTAAGVQKYVKSGGTWNFSYNFSIPQNIPASANNANGCFDLVVDWSGANPIVYATTTEGYGGDVNSNRVVRIVDTNANAVVTTIVQSPSLQKAYRGITFTPDLRPLITSEPVSYSTVVSSNANFSVAASSVYPLSYQWYSNGVPITDTGEFSGTATNLLTISNVQLGDATTYSVVITNAYGSVTNTPPVNLIVNVSPVLASVGPEQYLTNLIADNITIAANASGTDPKTYQWYTNGVLITDTGEFSGTTNSSLIINNAQVNDAAIYSVVISNPAGTTSNIVAQLTINYPPPAIINQPVSTTALQGSVANIGITGFGASLTYQWYSVVTTIVNSTNTTYSYLLVNSAITQVTNSIVTSVTNASIMQLYDGFGDISGSATSTLNFTNAAFSDTNVSYFAVITNFGGSITSQVATLSVFPIQSPSYVNYTNSGQIYAQSFDSLPVPSGATVNTANPATITVETNFIALTKDSIVNTYSLGDPYDFAAAIIPLGQVGGLGLAGTMNGWYGWAGTLNKLGASAGDQSTGGQISEGLPCIPPLETPDSSVTNRALGLLATSTTGPTSFGVKFINHTASTLTNINLHYVAEIWREQLNSQPLNIGYMIDAAGINSVLSPTNPAVVWLTNLTAIFPVSSDGKLHILDGTQSTNQISVDTNNMPIANWPPNSALWLIWEDTNSAGSGQGIAIDNLSFCATNNLLTTSKPVVTASGAALPYGAILNGTINPGGLATIYYFQYGVTTAYGAYTATNNLAAGPFTLPVSAQLNGLTTNQTYFFQLVASNSLGIATNTGSLSFISPASPALGILAASSIDQLDATFNGWVNPSNAVTTYYFNWGTTTSYGVSTTPTVLTSSAAVSNSVSLKISAGLMINTTYHYQLAAYNGVGGTNYSADASFNTTSGAKPSVANTGTTGITATNAVFNGTVNPNGLVTSYYFEYGSTASYGSFSPTNALAPGASKVTVTDAVTGLQPFTTNHYNLVAFNSAGNASTLDTNYVTLPLPPTAVTLAASNITSSSALFDATINPSGSTNRYWFQYGTTTNYGSVSQTNGLAAGTSAILITNLTSGLLKGTNYHYQIITVNSGGSSGGGDMNFTTLAIVPSQLVGVSLNSGVFSFSFTNVSGASFSVLATNNLAAPLANWPVVGQAIESPAGSGNYQFTNSSATNAQQFYILRQP